MKSGKEAARLAKKLFAGSLVDGRVDADKVRTVVKKLIDEKPRGYLKLVNAYWRLVRLEIERNQAVVETAVPLDESTRASVVSGLKKKYGDQIDVEFAEDPELIGGMRIRVGNDVWDGSVRNRIDRLSDTFH